MSKLTYEELNTITMSELYENAYEPKIPIVENFLYSGTYLFVGAPKVGKSFFMSQLSYHVAKGLPLWNNTVHKSTVLYLALEDTYGRLQKRLSDMFGVDGADNLYLATKSDFLGKGLIEQLEAFIEKNPDTRLVIIDTLQKVKQLGVDYSYSADYDSVTKLKAFADKYHICLLLVHHTRKMESDDCFDMISGTNGLLGAADGAFVIQKRKRTELEATMDVTGRDQQDMRYKMSFDPERHLWNLVETETELWKEPPNPLLEAINAFLTVQNPEWRGTATELLELLPDLGLNLIPSSLTKKLNVANGELRIKYGILLETKRSHERQIHLKRISDD